MLAFSTSLSAQSVRVKPVFDIQSMVSLLKKGREALKSTTQAASLQGDVLSAKVEGKQFLGIEFSKQNSQDWDSVGRAIKQQLGVSQDCPSFEIVGSSGSNMYSAQGGDFVKSVIQNQIISHGEYVLYYGATGYYQDGVYSDVNGALNDMLDVDPTLAKYVVANIVDLHIPMVVEQYEAVISPNVQNFYVVYSEDDEPACKFGDDIESSDNLTTHTVFCFEGGAQSFAQSMLVLKAGGQVQAFTGLLQPVQVQKNNLVAAELIKHIKTAFESAEFVALSDEAKAESVHTIVADYFSKYNKGLTNPKRWDAETKLGMLKKGVQLICENQLWARFEKVSVTEVNLLNPSLSSMPKNRV